MMPGTEKRNPAQPGRARGAEITNCEEGQLAQDIDLAARMQRQLARKIASGAGLSLAMAAAIVTLALNNGGRA